MVEGTRQDTGVSIGLFLRDTGDAKGPERTPAMGELLKPDEAARILGGLTETLTGGAGTDFSHTTDSQEE